MVGAGISAEHPLAREVYFVKSGRSERLALLLRDGRVVAVPLQLYPTLKAATAAVRGHWRLVGKGQGVHWPDLDLDLSTEGIVNARPDLTASARAEASEKEVTEAVLRAMADSGKPMSAAAVVELLERTYSTARLRDILRRLEQLLPEKPERRRTR